MKPEQAFWRNEIKPIFDKWGHATRTETGDTGAGFPDVSFCIAGTEGLLELKAGGLASLPSLRVSQEKWFRARHNAGGSGAVLLAKIEDENDNMYMLFDTKSVPRLFHADTIYDWIRLSCRNWRGKKLDGESFIYALLSTIKLDCSASEMFIEFERFKKFPFMAPDVSS